MMDIVRIPEDRIPALIGKKGRTKKSIEKWTGARIEAGDPVRIECEDPLMVLKAKDIVSAIGRGFPLHQTKRLLEEDCEFHLISLDGKTPRTRQRMMGRVIGNDGRVRKRIEEETGSLLCVRGKTIALIGKPGELAPAEDALSVILSGKTHAWAYTVMRRRKEKR
jgi:ribosomal RNA assembly protein